MGSGRIIYTAAARPYCILLFAALIGLLSAGLTCASDKTGVVTIYELSPVLKVTSGAGPEIYLDGSIEPNTPEVFANALADKNITPGHVCLNSPGGDLAAGIQLGREIRKRGLSTEIGTRGPKYGQAKPGGCYSACVLAYVGGYFRLSHKDSLLGAHRFSRTVISKDDLDLAQVVSARIVAYLKEMGISVELFERMTKVGKDQISILSLEDATRLQVVNNGKLAAAWTLENVDGVIFLTGTQTTWWGTGNFKLVCDEAGGVLVAVSFQVGQENAEQIAATYADHYSLRVDNDFFPVEINPSPLSQITDSYSLSFSRRTITLSI
jgi:hypothetical protein